MRTLETLYEAEEQIEKRKFKSSGTKENKVEINNEKSAFLKHKDNVDVIQASQDIEDAKVEWELVPATVRVSLPHPSHFHSTLPISFDEVITHFHEKDMTPFLKYIKPVKQRKYLGELSRWLFGPPKLQPLLIPDRDLLFAIAQCPFDTSEIIHLRVLQTVYKTLTGSQRDCPRYGHHWEEIGFQGMDPSTDLRGSGFLGLCHLLFFTTSPLTTDLSRQIKTLAGSEIQNFPFCVMGINITRIVLETLREEVLNKECNRRKEVLLVANEFYAALYLRLFQVWKEQKKTIMDSGFVLKDLSNLAKSKPSVIFQGLKDYLDGKAKLHLQAHCSFSGIDGITLKPSAVML